MSELDAPVCVLHDPDQDVYFVSNIKGAGTAKDDNGYISRVGPDGQLTERRFIEGGHGGVTLNAPKGLAIMGDELWVADIDVVRSFGRRTGKPLRVARPPSPGALFLNEMAVGPQGALYVTDTRLQFHGDEARHVGPDRVFRIDRSGTVSVALQAISRRRAGSRGMLHRDVFFLRHCRERTSSRGGLGQLPHRRSGEGSAAMTVSSSTARAGWLAA